MAAFSSESLTNHLENTVLSDVHVHAQRERQHPNSDSECIHEIEKKALSRFYFTIPDELQDPQDNDTFKNNGTSSSRNENAGQSGPALQSSEAHKQNEYVQDQETDTLFKSCDTYGLDCDGDLNLSRRKAKVSSNMWYKMRTARFNLQSSSSCQGSNETPDTLLPSHEKSLGVITIEHRMETSLKDVGYQLWAGALLLCDYLLEHGNSLKTKGSGVLDLGAGVGITSIVAAMFAPWVICTDYRSDILAQAEQNWHRNKWLLPQVECAEVLFRILDWNSELSFHSEADKDSKNKYVFGEKEEEILRSTNTILAAEVIYDEDLTDAFFKTIYYLLLKPPSKYVLVTLEKRIVFQTENFEVRSPAYEHFCDNLEDLVSVDKGPVRFIAEQISTDFPQHFQYSRTKEMELWRISSKFTDAVNDKG